MSAPTHYDRLGVEPTAPVEDIQRAYRLLALRHHPDVAPDADPAAMAAINVAWDVLRDPVRRQDYDRVLGRPTPPPPPRPATPPSWDWRPLDDDEDDGDPEDLDDAPYVAVAHKPTDHLVMTPVLLLLAAVGLFFFAMMAGSTMLRTLAILLVPLSGIGFVMAPLFVMMRSKSRSGE
ncbi:MAG: J domain-containing protein [Actinomycetota bacterium]|nr:J domain-containing protein [Actinomycetota bacterium]